MNVIPMLVPLGLLVAAAPVVAQPSLPPVAPPNTLPDDPEEPAPVVVSAPVVVAEPRPREEPPASVEPMREATSPRPTGLALGLGLGYVVGGNLDTPNVTSARLRLAGGLTFEPRITLGHTSSTENFGGPETTSTGSVVDLALGVRYPLHTHGKVELSLLGAAGVGLVTANPDGDANNRTSSSFDVDWGVALDLWLTQHWDLSFSASNPILVVTKSDQEQGLGAPDSKTSATTIGAIFDPTLAVMLHLYL